MYKNKKWKIKDDQIEILRNQLIWQHQRAYNVFYRVARATFAKLN